MKIGITYTGHADKHENYVKWIKGNDPSIQIFKLSPKEKIDITALDGIVLSGGVDIHPRFYRGDEKYKNAPSKFKEERDEFEFGVLDTAISKNIPVLGICRGLQLINVFRKGTLVQDLNEKNDVHRDAEEDNKHHVSVKSDTALFDIVRENSGNVNSAHHQSIEKLGNNLVANSYADDGTIEGIEWKDKTGYPFMLAVQWHPERMNLSGLGDSPFSKNIRDHFLSEINANLKK